MPGVTLSDATLREAREKAGTSEAYRAALEALRMIPSGLSMEASQTAFDAALAVRGYVNAPEPGRPLVLSRRE